MQTIGYLLRRESGRTKTGVVIMATVLGLASVLAFTNPSTAAPGSLPKAFANEADQGTYPGFTANTLTDLSAQCPQGIAGTPGSEPSTKFLNPALNDADSFKAGGTVHYSYIDNPNFASQNYQIDDCVAVYPESTFQAGDFDPVTGVVIPGTVTKTDLNKGVEIDAASFSGVFDSTGSTYFNWTAPANLVGGQWVCNFARDIATGHGGGGNRKVLPSCYQVPKTETPVTEPTVVAGACGEQDTISLPETEGVTWFLDDVNTPLADGDSLTPGAHTVIAQQAEQADQTFPITASTVEAADDCKGTVTAHAVTSSTGCGRADRYTVPTDADVDYFIVTGTAPNEVLTPVNAGTYDLAQGVTVKIRALPKDPANDKTTGTVEWSFTGLAVVACSTPTPTPDPITTTTTTTEPPTTTTTTSIPELPFVPEEEGEVEPLEIEATTTTVPPAELPFTGSANVGYLTVIGFVTLGLGVLLHAAARRRRQVG